jgi:ribosomal protein L40E
MEILGIPIALVAFWVVYILYKSVGEKQIFGDRCMECQSVLNQGATRCAKCGSSINKFQSETYPSHASGIKPLEKTCPACISQVPFIASKCRFCGTELVVEVPQGGRPSVSDQINESNRRSQSEGSTDA